MLEIIPLLEDLAASDDIYSILGARCPRPSLPQAHPLDGDSNNNTNEQIFSGQRTYDTNVIHQTPRPSDSSPITQCLPTTRIVVPSDQYNSNGDGWRRTVPAPTTRLLIDAPPGQLSNSTNKPYTSPINSSSLARPMTNSTPIHSTVRIRMLDDENRVNLFYWFFIILFIFRNIEICDDPSLLGSEVTLPICYLHSIGEFLILFSTCI